jgi:hypothetical protein
MVPTARVASVATAVGGRGVEVGAGNVAAGAQDINRNVRIMKPTKQLNEAFILRSCSNFQYYTPVGMNSQHVSRTASPTRADFSPAISPFALERSTAVV